MHRLSIQIDQTRGIVRNERLSPQLSLTLTVPDLATGLRRAIRLLSSELEQLEANQNKKTTPDDDFQDNDEEGEG